MVLPSHPYHLSIWIYAHFHFPDIRRQALISLSLWCRMVYQLNYLSHQRRSNAGSQQTLRENSIRAAYHSRTLGPEAEQTSPPIFWGPPRNRTYDMLFARLRLKG